MKKVPTVWNDLYCTQASGTLLSTHKAARVIALARPLLDIRTDDTYDRDSTIADICRVHDPKYVRAVVTGTPRRLAESQGFRWSPEFAESVLRIWSGHIAACRLALDEGLVLHPVSGSHHAHRSHGSGFCSFAFLVGAGRRLLDDGAVSRVAIIDLDFHFGDGTFALTKDDHRFFRFDVQAAHDRDSYFRELAALPAWLRQTRPGLVEYQAGADVFEGDHIGGVDGMTAEAIRERDRFVFNALCGVPTVTVLAGGYVPGTTEAIHVGTTEEMSDAIASRPTKACRLTK
jgi:acetoin utilization deacetylase AcuC-like enzyme